MSLRSILIILFMLASGFIYLFLRNDVTVLHEILKRLGWTISNDFVVTHYSSLPLKILAYNIPELFWIIALMLSFQPIILATEWMNKNVGLIITWGFVILEALQFLQVTNGTFDILDIVMVILGVRLSRMLEQTLLKNDKKQVRFHYNFESIRVCLIYLSIFFAHQM